MFFQNNSQPPINNQIQMPLVYYQTPIQNHFDINFPEIFLDFNQRINLLTKEVLTLKQQIAEMTTQAQRQPMERPQQTNSGQMEKVEGQVEYVVEKSHKKNIKCHVDDCTHRYSSRIAMRAHMRKKHPEIIQKSLRQRIPQ